MAGKVLASIGGKKNIIQVEACITRLRLHVKDESLIQEKALKELGAAGIIKLGKGQGQIFLTLQGGTPFFYISSVLRAASASSFFSKRRSRMTKSSHASLLCGAIILISYPIVFFQISNWRRLASYGFTENSPLVSLFSVCKFSNTYAQIDLAARSAAF